MGKLLGCYSPSVHWRTKDLSPPKPTCVAFTAVNAAQRQALRVPQSFWHFQLKSDPKMECNKLDHPSADQTHCTWTRTCMQISKRGSIWQCGYLRRKLSWWPIDQIWKAVVQSYFLRPPLHTGPTPLLHPRKWTFSPSVFSLKPGHWVWLCFFGINIIQCSINELMYLFALAINTAAKWTIKK